MSYKHQLPPAVPLSYNPYPLDNQGQWLVLSDTHIPYHDAKTIELAVGMAVKQKAVGVLLNGDVMDSHELSTFDRDPTMPRYSQELEYTGAFFAYLRERLPKARIVFKEGNHEERLGRFLMRRAPALFGLACVSLPKLLELDKYGIEFVGDKRVVRLGRLNVLHGHEFRPNVQCPVNPARGVFLRAKSICLVGHWHQTSEHHEPTITGKPQGAWSTGCACQLSPAYSPINRWCHGFAVVDITKGGEFSVRNLRVWDGKVV